MWAILDNLTTTDTEEVTIDAGANWKALRPPMSAAGAGLKGMSGAAAAGGADDDSDSKRFCKVMSPGSTALPTWDNSQSQMMNGGGGVSGSGSGSSNVVGVNGLSAIKTEDGMPDNSGGNSNESAAARQQRLSKQVLSPGSTALPNWDNSQAMSPYMCPDMSSIASGSMMGQK